MLTGEDIVNRGLDILGVSKTVGDLQEGTTEARVALRNYIPVMQEVFRAVHWNCLRRRATLTLLEDATGQSDPPVGTGTVNMHSWIFEYKWPLDCMKARYVPANYLAPGATPPIPLTTDNSLFPNYWAPVTPAPFLVGTDAIPNLSGAIPNWNQLPDLNNAQGQGLNSQVVILTNVPNAELVYTARITEPNTWDPALQQAIAAVLASRMAMGVIVDKKLAVAMQRQASEIARATISDARVSNGNEQQTSLDRTPDWIAARTMGSSYNYGYNGNGILWGSWDSISLAGLGPF